MSDRVMDALACLGRVGAGDRDGYYAALERVARLVPCPVKQLALVDDILAARKRAYTEAA